MSELVDALPYIDHEYNDPQIRNVVSQMIEDETRRYKATKNYLETLPSLPEFNVTQFETDILRNEFERLQNGQPMEGLSMKRYELPNPNAGKLNDVWAWNECLENSYAQLEHQAIRINNLELMSCYGAESWKVFISSFAKLTDRCKAKLDELRKEIQEINLSRKTSQLTAGEKSKMLEETWVALVSKNYEIERACVQLESQITRLETELEQNIKK